MKSELITFCFIGHGRRARNNFHAPLKIHFVAAIPKTRNAKVMRRVVRAAYLGEDAGDLSALENPGAVEEIKNVFGE